MELLERDSIGRAVLGSRLWPIGGIRF
jgi:hypothetical protein